MNHKSPVTDVHWVGQHLIDGKSLAGTNGVFENRNPARRSQILGSFPLASPEEVNRAVAAARKAFGPWRRLSPIRRGEFIDRMARRIESQIEDLATIVSLESGKVFNEARAEVVEGLHMLQYVVGTARQPIGSCVASELEEKDLYVRRKPRGIVAVITPWNFPFAVPLWMIGPSLQEGNTIVFKPSEETPRIGERIVQIAVEAGLPSGTINLVHGTGAVAGDALARHSDVDVVCFTGSYEVGQAIRKLAADSDHKTCACEMGSKSAVIVCDDADLDLAADAAVLSAFKTTGQRCVSAGRVLVQRKVIEAFTQKLLARAEGIRFGDPFDKASFAGPLINRAAMEKVRFYNQLAKNEGAKILLDERENKQGNLADGNFVAPFIYQQEHRPSVRTIREEVFGPHLAVIPFDTDEDAARIYNDTPYGLSMAVITENYRRWRWFRDECDYGMGYVNLPCIGAEVHLPFGGVKKSGNGQPSAAALVDAVTHRIAFTVNHGRQIAMAQGLSSSIPTTQQPRKG